MQRPRGRSVLRILIGAEGAILLALLCLTICYFLYRNRAFLHFPHAWDPGDGDVLNAIHRIRRGLPIYGDWGRGEIMLAYPPLMPLSLVLLSLFGLDPVSWLRRLNLLMICLSSGIVVGVAFAALRPGPLRWSLAALAGLLFFTAWRLL